MTIDPEHGKTLQLTLDMNIQRIVEAHIAEFDKAYGDDEHQNKGAAHIGIVVMDPNNGEVLAMASNNSYDLNNPRDMSKYYTAAEVRQMSDEEYAIALNDMWRNFCVSYGF